jgi:hypothetical protein
MSFTVWFCGAIKSKQPPLFTDQEIYMKYSIIKERYGGENVSKKLKTRRNPYGITGAEDFFSDGVLYFFNITISVLFSKG